MANFLHLCNSTGTIAWRVWPLHEALREEGHEAISINSPGMTNEVISKALRWADVITFQMVAATELHKKAKEAGIYTIFDCDDLISWLPKKHIQYATVSDKNYQRLFNSRIRDVDMVTVATPQLKEEMGKKNDNVVVVPNYLPDTFWERGRLRNETNRIRLGWAGGITHVEDLEYIRGIITKIIREYDNVDFVYVGGGGWNNKLPTKYRYGEDLFPDIPYNRKEYSPGERIEMWPDRLNSLRLDVVIAPLEENRFSRCKSQIKYYEYAINRWPGVYQGFHYKNVQHGKTGFLADTQDEWYNYLKILIEDSNLRKEVGENAYRDVKDNYTFRGHRDEWLNIYRQAAEKSRQSSDQFFVC